jgi:hypothetical protein
MWIRSRLSIVQALSLFHWGYGKVVTHICLVHSSLKTEERSGIKMLKQQKSNFYDKSNA